MYLVNINTIQYTCLDVWLIYQYSIWSQPKSHAALLSFFFSSSQNPKHLMVLDHVYINRWYFPHEYLTPYDPNQIKLHYYLLWRNQMLPYSLIKSYCPILMTPLSNLQRPLKLTVNLSRIQRMLPGLILIKKWLFFLTILLLKKPLLRS